MDVLEIYHIGATLVDDERHLYYTQEFSDASLVVHVFGWETELLAFLERITHGLD